MSLPSRQKLEALWQGYHTRLENALTALSQDDPDHIAQALEVIAMSRNPGLASQITPLLAHPEPSLRAKAVQTLAAIGALESLKELLNINSPNQQARLEADWSSVLWGFDHPELLSHWPDDLPLPDMSMLGAWLTDPQINAWKDCLNHANPVKKTNALKLLGRLLMLENSESALVWLKDPDPEIRVRCLGLAHEQLQAGKLSPSEAFEHLVPLLADPDERIRWIALMVLGPLFKDPSRFCPTAWEELKAKPRPVEAETYLFWDFEQHRYKSFFQKALQDPNPAIRLEALEYVIPWSPDQAREALETLFTRTGWIDAPASLLTQFTLWPRELKPLLRELITPFHPVKNVGAWLEMLGHHPSEWPEMLADWIEHPYPPTRIEAILAFQQADLELPQASLYNSVDDEDPRVRQAISAYLSTSSRLRPDDRAFFLRYLFLEEDPITAANVCTAIWDTDLKSLARYLLNELDSKRIPRAAGRGAASYLIQQDGKLKLLSQKLWKTLLARESVQLASFDLLNQTDASLPPAMIDALWERIQQQPIEAWEQLWQSFARPNQPRFTSIWARLLTLLPVQASFWQKGEFGHWLLHPRLEIRIIVLRQIARHLPALPGTDTLLQLAAIQLEDPHFRIRRAALNILGIGQRLEHLPLMRQALQDPAREVRQEAIHWIGLWVDRDAAPILFELMECDTLRTRRLAAEVLASWQLIGPTTNWLDHYIRDYPVGLWCFWERKPEHPLAHAYLDFDRLAHVLFFRENF